MLEHRRERHAARRRDLAGEQAIEPGPRTGAADRVRREARGLDEADLRTHGGDLRGDGVEVRRAVPAELVAHALGRVPQRHLEPGGRAELRAARLEAVVERRGLERPAGRQLLVREADREAPRVVLLHLGVGVGLAGPVAEARDIHRPDIHAGVAVDHPVGEREADAAALAEAGHHAAGAPVTLQPAHRADQRIAVGREGERPVDDPLDARVLERREMLEADLERGRDAVDVGLQQLVAEGPGRRMLRPGLAGLLVGAHEHAAAFLAQVELAVEVDGVQHLLAGRAVDLGDLGHVLGDEVHVLHREHRMLAADHVAHLARPETACVDHMLGVDLAAVGDHAPGAVGVLDQLLDLGEALDVRAELARGLGVGLRGAGRVEMAVDHRFERTDEAGGVEQRHQLVRTLGGDDLGVDAEVAALGDRVLEPVEARFGGRQHHAAREVQPRGLARQLLDLLIKVDRVLLELGDVRIAVDRVHASGRMPGRPRREFVAFEQHRVGPAELGEVVEDGAADDSAADDDSTCSGLHGSKMVTAPPGPGLHPADIAMPYFDIRGARVSAHNVPDDGRETPEDGHHTARPAWQRQRAHPYRIRARPPVPDAGLRGGA